MGAGKNVFNKYCISPVRCGIGGFAIFLVVVVATKLLAAIFGSGSGFDLEKEDIFLSLLGFVMFFAIKILNNINEKKI